MNCFPIEILPETNVNMGTEHSSPHTFMETGHV